MEDLERAIEEHLPLPPLCGDRCTCGTWAEVNKCARAPMRNLARAALRAIEGAGYVVLPTTDLDTLRRHNEAAEQRGLGRALGEPE